MILSRKQKRDLKKNMEEKMRTILGSFSDFSDIKIYISGDETSTKEKIVLTTTMDDSLWKKGPSK